MGRKYDFDYIIIGSGPAGAAAALTLAKGKRKIAIVEGGDFGGSAMNTRDIPYSASLSFAHTYDHVTNIPEIRGQDIHYNFPTIVAHTEHIARLTGAGDKNRFEDAGITCINGNANFLDSNTIAVGEKKYTSSIFILATGSTLKATEISGLDTVNYLTPATAIKARRLPKAVLVVGGGASGCEIAEYFAELGTKVLIMERSEHLLPREDKEVGETMAKYFTDELGMMVLTSCRVVALEQDNTSKKVIFTTNRQEKMVRVDCIVLATGSQPILDYGLENAGVKYKPTGILVDKLFQTSAKNIYAIGDSIGAADTSYERAEYEGTILGTNLLHRAKNIVSYAGFARITDTYPQIAVVGMNEYDLLKRDHKCKRATVNLTDTLNSKIHGMEYGFVKLLADHNNRIIGATIVAPNASEMISEIAVAVRHRLNALEIASTPHPALSYSAAIKLAAKQIVNKK